MPGFEPPTAPTIGGATAAAPGGYPAVPAPAPPPHAAAAPGGAGGGSHYGHLQHTPSFDAAAGAPGGGTAATPAAAAGAATPQPPTAWLLASGPAAASTSSASMPPVPVPRNGLIGPFVRFLDYEPTTNVFAASVLVVAAPSLPPGSEVQLHWAVDAPATTRAASQVLGSFMGYSFVRFDVSLQLLEAPAVVNYVVGLVGGQAPLAAHTFHLPARGQSWRWLFYSCNGFHEAEPEAKYGGISHLWGDVLRRHVQQPYHLQVGGGDQLYCDHVLELPSLQPWLAVDDPHARAGLPFTPAMLAEAEQYYFGHYCRHFSDPAFGPALASIPFHFSWDDHDIFDGFGSYPSYLQHSAVFQGLFAVARRFYLLFQHHCRYDNAAAISRTLAGGPGSYSYHTVRNIGPDAIMVCPDTRSERTIHQVLPPAAWDLLFAEVTARLACRPPGSVNHVLVLLPVPIVYPKIPVSETVLAAISKGMASQKPVREWVSRLNLPSGAVSVFKEPDLLDDLLDHWTSADHVAEREALVRRLQALAAQWSVRVTFLSGDVHVGAFGCFQGHPKEFIRVVDPKFMLQVVSSAIGNEPPPAGVITALQATSMANTTLGQDTLDKMIKAFPGGQKLRPLRNYCEVGALHARACDVTGAPQPPGGLSFTLRVELRAHGTFAPAGIETVTQVAPVLLAGPRAGEAGPYCSHSHRQELHQAASGVKQSIKTLGHKLSNVLARV